MPDLARVAWLIASNDEKIASIRYRALYPNAGLKELGYKTKTFWKTRQLYSKLSDFDAIIIVKRLDPELLDLISLAKETGKKVYLDLCDNIISRDYRNSLHSRNRMVFRAISPLLDGIVVTGSVLADQICKEGPYPSEKTFIVEDCAETQELMRDTANRLHGAIDPAQITNRSSGAPNRTSPRSLIRAIASQLGRFDAQGNLQEPPQPIDPNPSLLGQQLRRVTARLYRTVRFPRRSLQVIKDVRREHAVAELDQSSEDQTSHKPKRLKRKNIVLWFGNHGGPHSDFGMLSLLKMATALRAAHARTPFTLVVVSNNIAKYKAVIAKLGLRTQYVEWSQNALQEYLDTAKVCIIPTGDDSFSQAKSANRHVLALANGVPVVAGPLASTKPLERCITTKNWAKAISTYLTDDEIRTRHLNEASEIIQEHYTFRTVAQAWHEILINQRPHHKMRRRAKRDQKSSLLVLIDLVQDIALALPMISAAKAAGFRIGVIVSERALRSNERLIDWLIKEKICPTFISASDTKVRDFRWLRNADALLTLSETDQNPHKIAHYVTGIANTIGLPTFTIQHGLENIGLTYRDSEYPNVSIAANTIFTWGAPEKLPQWVPEDIRRRAVGVGRIKPPHQASAVERMGSLKEANPTVGIFENLHWSRFSDNYRDEFIANAITLAETLPHFRFLIKSHPAGKWTDKTAQSVEWPANVTFFSQSEQWRQRSIEQVLDSIDAVITTPSSVALDAVEQKKPVALVGGNGCVLDAYKPLEELNGAADWIAFAKSALESNSKCREKRAAEFLSRSLISNEGTDNIIRFIASEIVEQ